MADDLRQRLLALADRWEIHVERPGAFYPEAGAWADGVEAGYSRAADELRDAVVTASQADKQPPDSSSVTNSGQGADRRGARP